MGPVRRRMKVVGEEFRLSLASGKLRWGEVSSHFGEMGPVLDLAGRGVSAKVVFVTTFFQGWEEVLKSLAAGERGDIHLTVTWSLMGGSFGHR